jgi:hypothetical protein
MRNIIDVTGGKPIAVWSQSIPGVNAINPLVTFCDIHEREKCYSFILSRTPHMILCCILLIISSYVRFITAIAVYTYRIDTTMSYEWDDDVNGGIDVHYIATGEKVVREGLCQCFWKLVNFGIKYDLSLANITTARWSLRGILCYFIKKYLPWGLPHRHVKPHYGQSLMHCESKPNVKTSLNYIDLIKHIEGWKAIWFKRHLRRY